MTSIDSDVQRGYSRRSQAKRFKVRMDFINEMKSGPCHDCGNSFPPECMDFDHRDDEHKFRGISDMLSYSLERLMAEVAKCDLVCANCHRIRTKSRRVPLVQ